jgi:hypothetical protein
MSQSDNETMLSDANSNHSMPLLRRKNVDIATLMPTNDPSRSNTATSQDMAINSIRILPTTDRCSTTTIPKVSFHLDDEEQQNIMLKHQSTKGAGTETKYLWRNMDASASIATTIVNQNH